MIAGDTVAKVLYLQTLSGRALSYATKAAFQADGWNLSWLNTAADALASQPTWTIEPSGTNGRHVVEFTVPSGVALAMPTVPGWAMDPGSWVTEGQAYDEDSMAGLFLTAQGVPGVQSAADGDLGDVVMGDSWTTGTLTVPLGKISPFGYSDLTGMTLTAGLKQDPTSTGATAVASGVTPNLFTTIVDAAARTVSAQWITFPAAMNLAATADALSSTWYLDLQLVHTASGRKITPLRYTLRVVWQRDVV